MKSILTLLFVFFICSKTEAQDTINAKDAKDYVGKMVTLCDRVNYGRYVRMEKDRPVTLYVGPDYPNHYLTLVFTQANMRYFNFDPEKKMINKRFCVNGVISKYKGKPAIYIQKEGQLNEEE